VREFVSVRSECLKRKCSKIIGTVEGLAEKGKEYEKRENINGGRTS
jgi:hypothetical protein